MAQKIRQNHSTVLRRFAIAPASERWLLFTMACHALALTNSVPGQESMDPHPLHDLPKTAAA
jgi:hypothetical protein